MIRVPYQTKSRLNRKQLMVLLAIVALVVAAGAGALYRHHQASVNAEQQAAAAPRPVSEKGTGNSSTAQTNNGTDNQKAQGSENTTTPTPQPASASQPLQKPAGTFVSNHKPGQNGSPEQESSVCMTTPGATCSISFTQGSVTKALPSQTADSTGSVYWQSWTPASLGLSAGSWTITATATQGQQSLSTQDPNALEVK